MRVCPNCHCEYLDAITRCKDCGVDVVAPEDVVSEKALRGNPRDALADVEKAALSVRNLDGGRELERLLGDAGIVCYVDAEETEGAPMSPGTMSYSVVISQEDIEPVKTLLEGMQRNLLAAEGLENLADHVVDLDADEVDCPACGHKGPLDDDGACSDCGLVLGVS